MAAVRIRVLGKVQGVWFRASTQSKANQLELVGYVRNCEDGSVLIEASGSKERIDELIEWCQTGPENARVDKVITEEISAGNFSKFEIRR